MIIFLKMSKLTRPVINSKNISYVILDIPDKQTCCICSGDRVLILKEPEDPHKTNLKATGDSI